MLFEDRADAGRQLAGRLTAYAGRSDVIVLALPRGGVPVAFEVARKLAAPLDVFLVRKLGVPGHPELAMGAIAEGGVEVVSEDVIDELGIPRVLVRQVAARERLELDRRDHLYRGGRRQPLLRDRTVVLVDDGLATGATMKAAILALRQHQPARVVVAAPVGATETCDRLRRLADEVVCLATPDPFHAVGLWYRKFGQTSDEEVGRLLTRAGLAAFRPDSPPLQTSNPVEIVRRRAQRLMGDPAQYDSLLEGIGDARVVLLGEATHGTHEFYRERAFITRRLITEKGFTAVAVEADWPDAHRVNRYVRRTGADEESVDALGDATCGLSVRQERKGDMKINDIMTHTVESCTPETSLTQVAKLMWSAGCGAIPIVDAKAKVVGIITDRDISNALVSTSRRPGNIPAREAMTSDVHACGPEDDVKAALETMKKYRVRRLPVLSREGQLRGILSIDDVILRALAPDAPTSAEIVAALRDILQYRRLSLEPDEVS